MAKSKAKKLRTKLVREGRMNPEEKRSPFIFTDMRTRKTKTKKDYLYQSNQKNHHSQEGNDGSLYLYIKYRFIGQFNFNSLFFNNGPVL
ncbi:MAG: hypothetical protein K0Q87_2149 [Neobacillus sp.]|jgi:hypothetical protein|nr:hypothetical protein [Neobacillus sp.]